jgi:hypothetical protein
MSDSNSSSDSSQSQLQESQDNRITAGEGAVALVASRSSVGGDVNLTSTDFGTVNKAFDFANAIAKGAASEAAASSAKVAEMATSAMQSVKQAYAGSNETIADAYETSKAGEQKVMVAVGLAVVGMVAFRAMGRA